MQTRTGNYPIGMRCRNLSWESDLTTLLNWLKSNGLEVIDLGINAPELIEQVLAAQVKVGTVDLPNGRMLISADASKRQEAVERTKDYIATCGAFGPMTYFVLMTPEDPGLSPQQNFTFMVDAYGALIDTLKRHQARIAIEGWPGRGVLCCTPETLRAFFKEVDSLHFGVNYDPSHLVRMHIDYMRFLKEFGPRVFHVHGKDTAIDQEALYQYGVEIAPASAEPARFSGAHWRYTIPGHGQVQWTKIFEALSEMNYAGAVCIELEDSRFDQDPVLEKQGVLLGARHLASC